MGVVGIVNKELAVQVVVTGAVLKITELVGVVRVGVVGIRFAETTPLASSAAAPIEANNSFLIFIALLSSLLNCSVN